MRYRGALFLSSGLAVLFGLALSGNSQAMQIDKLAVVAANDIKPASQDGQDVPMGQSATGQGSLLPEETGGGGGANLFGLKGGYVHPYVTLQQAFTDNVYYVHTNKTSSSITTISPGIWFAVPGKKQIPVAINPTNTAPGGLQSQFKDHEGTDRIQAYARAGMDLSYYSTSSDLNSTNAVLEGMFRYNMSSGLSLQIAEQYRHGEEGFSTPTVGGQQPKYNSNFSLATVDWKMTEKFRTKVEYSNFLIDYDSGYTFRSRVDNAFDFYQYYIYSVKTSFFLEDKVIDVHYDNAGSVNDNSQNFIFGGIKWDTTEKISILAKAGLQTRNFDDSGPGRKDYSGLAFDMQTQYRPTIKTKLTLDIYRMDEETDYVLASGKLVTGARFGYAQYYTNKISGSLDLLYEYADYAELPSQPNNDQNRIFLRPAVQYHFRDWLIGEVAFEYDNRDSTYSPYSYQSDTLLFNLKFAL
jgi:polysaccharide biosynthesis protein VpsM